MEKERPGPAAVGMCALPSPPRLFVRVCVCVPVAPMCGALPSDHPCSRTPLFLSPSRARLYARHPSHPPPSALRRARLRVLWPHLDARHCAAIGPSSFATLLTTLPRVRSASTPSCSRDCHRLAQPHPRRRTLSPHPLPPTRTHTHTQTRWNIRTPSLATSSPRRLSYPSVVRRGTPPFSLSSPQHAWQASRFSLHPHLHAAALDPPHSRTHRTRRIVRRPHPPSPSLPPHATTSSDLPRRRCGCCRVPPLCGLHTAPSPSSRLPVRLSLLFVLRCCPPPSAPLLASPLT